MSTKSQKRGGECIKAPNLLSGEFKQTLALLTEQPDAGLLAEDNEEIRRLLLRKSRYAVFYRVNEEELQVELLAFWHNSRQAPEL